MVGDFLVLDTPGHTIGSKSFYHKDSKILMAGDTLFYHSYGRFDLPTGSQHQLVESLKKLCSLDRKSTRLNSSHANISYAVFCLKKKKNITLQITLLLFTILHTYTYL